MGERKGITYDSAAVGRMLGIPIECDEPAPEVPAGQVVVWYGGWDLRTLRCSDLGRENMYQHGSPFTEVRSKSHPGYYTLLLPVANSEGMDENEQLRQLEKTHRQAKPAPSCITALVLLLHQSKTGVDLLKGGLGRCAETTPNNVRAAIGRIDGVLKVDYLWNRERGPNLWLTACWRHGTSPPEALGVS